MLREISASVRRLMNSDGAGVTLPDPDTGELGIYALDFPTSKGYLKEGTATSELASASIEQCFRTGKTINLAQEQILMEKKIAAEGSTLLVPPPADQPEQSAGCVECRCPPRRCIQRG